MRNAPPASFPVGHQMILASAGSGKTHDLTTRFFTLMVAGVTPEKIIALTFSRKSAGEFFNRILSRLAQAANSDASAAALDQAIREQEERRLMELGQLAMSLRPPLTKESATSMLVDLVDRLHLLTLGTMDSFFIRMARSFPLELGLSGDFTILDSQLELAARQRIYHKIFQPQAQHLTDQRDFIAAFQQATHGKEETSLVKNLDAFIKTCNGYFTEARSMELWGQPEVIWPHGDRPRNPGITLTQAATAALDYLSSPRSTLTDGQASVLQFYLEEMVHHAPFTALKPKSATVVAKLAEVHADLIDGSAEITLDRAKVKLGQPLCHLLWDVIDAQAFADFETGCRQMQGIWRILNRYDQNYDVMVRQQGQLTFSDVQQLLSGDLARGEDAGMQFMENRALLDFRLDAQFDHWLLDEFQDTNGRQWGILSNLINEVIQDDSSLRTFFAVGDVKQAIHMWRGSDPDLMDRLLTTYNSHSLGAIKRISTLTKAMSWRCAPDVLSLVNAVLVDRERLGEWLPEGTLGPAWNYETHQPAPKNANLTGYAEVVVAVPDEKDKSKDQRDEDCLSFICGKLLEMRPLERGLSCVVLVMTNPQAIQAAEIIRNKTGLLVSCESDENVVDQDAACAGFLDLMRMSCHPLNTFARRHVEMSPWLEVATQLNSNDSDSEQNNVLARAAAHIRKQVLHEGMASVVRYWINGLLAVRPELPAYSFERLNGLASLAAEFDQTGSRDLDEFITLAEAQTMRDTSTSRSIHVMTCFKAKGLEWDIVFATGFNEGKHSGVFDSTAVQYDDERQIQWITKVPNKDLALLNPTMQRMDEARIQWRWRQNICLLYVILTRAKRATHVVLTQPTKDTKARRLDNLILSMLSDSETTSFELNDQQLQRIWASGSPEWFLSAPLREIPPVPAVIPQRTTVTLPKRPRLLRKRPSDQPSRSYFSLDRSRGMEWGNAVHQILARLPWIDSPLSTLLRELIRPVAKHLQDEVSKQLQWSLRQPAIAAIFDRTASQGHIDLWLEREFDFIADGTHFSGTFDRVVIEKDAAGNVTKATVYEFKTDTADSASSIDFLTKRYSPQVQEYCRAVGALLGFPAEGIEAKLVFLSAGLVVRIKC